MKATHILFVICASILLGSITSFAALPTVDNSSSAEEIVRAATAEGALGFSQGKATVEMHVTKKNGKKTTRTLSVIGKNTGEGTGRTLMRFTAPANIAGSAFLVVQNSNRIGEQYLFLPAVGQVQQIAASKTNKSFFGSDLSYADLMPLRKGEKGKAQFTKLEDIQVGGQDAFQIEVYPNIPGAPYKKVILAIHKSHLVPLQIQYFDKKEEPLKTLMVKRLKKIGARYLPVELSIQHLVRGSKTELKLVEINPDADVDDGEVSKSALIL